MAADFAERFCADEGITPDRWQAVVLRHALYPHARLLRPIVALFDPEFFAADRDFLNGVGRLNRRSDFALEADEFAHHPANRGFARRALRLRVRRLHQLVVRTLPEENQAAGAARLRAARRST